MTVSDARNTFGQLVKRLRAERSMDRGEFAQKVGVELVVITRLEHGVENPTRAELVRAIKVLNPDKKEKDILYGLLRVFSPSHRRRVKFHLSFDIRNRRHNRF